MPQVSIVVVSAASHGYCDNASPVLEGNPITDAPAMTSP
jgi:hypothetical protein